MSCKKDNNPSENLLTGIWVKGANAGDTLQFMKKDGKSILRYNRSGNAAFPSYAESEYRYTNGKLDIKTFSPTIQEFYPITSFTWKRTGREFEILGIELFAFLSSTQVRYMYRKL